LVALALAPGPSSADAQPFAYVPNYAGHSVSVIDTATRTVTATIPVGLFPSGVAVHPSGALVYVVNNGDFTVSVINASTNAVTATVPVGSFPFGVAVHPAGTFVYVTNQTDGTVSVINTSTNTVTAVVPVGSNPAGVAVLPSGTFAYVANFGDGTLSIIDTGTNTASSPVPVGSSPAGVVANRAGTRVYVAIQGEAEGRVAVIDTASQAVVASLPSGLAPTGVGVSPSGATVYTTDQGAFPGTVSVIDVATRTVSATVPVGVSPFGLSVHPSGALVYAANFASNTVSVISTASNTVIDDVTVGNGPFSFGEFIGPLTASRNQLTALGTASLWLGVANSDDNGRRIDVRVEIYKNTELIGVGELLNQRVAGNALANATALAIPLTLVGGAVDVGSLDVLSSKVKVRRRGGSGNFGVRFWYGHGLPPPSKKGGWSRFGATLGGAEMFLYYRGPACPLGSCVRELEPAPGATGVASVVKATASWDLFGEWFTTPIIFD
jgi:YVTN family beta-propeller protein